MEKGRSEENRSRCAVRGAVCVLLFVFTLLFGANWKSESESKRRKWKVKAKVKEKVKAKWKANEATRVERETKRCVLFFGVQIRGVNSG